MMSQRKCQMFVVLCFVASVAGEDNYRNVWSLSGARNNDGSTVVTSESILIQPSSYSGKLYVPARQSRDFNHQKYAFKPRAVPIKKLEPQVYYSQDNVNKHKSEILFPGNYFRIAKEKSIENSTQDNNPNEERTFHPKAIPLMRGNEGRSLDIDEENDQTGTEKPRSFSDAVAEKRSISSALGIEDDDENEDEEDQDYEVEEDAEDTRKSSKGNKIKVKTHKYKKYMLPLLLAYKMKYFALVPVMIGGLVLLVGATGLAGFFFALFAAVMGLQKGGGY